jgi:hypothetical protein
MFSHVRLQSIFSISNILTKDPSSFWQKLGCTWNVSALPIDLDLSELAWPAAIPSAHRAFPVNPKALPQNPF